MSIQEQIKTLLEQNASEIAEKNLYKIDYEFDEAYFEVNDVKINAAELKEFTYEQIEEMDSYIKGSCTLHVQLEALNDDSYHIAENEELVLESTGVFKEVDLFAEFKAQKCNNEWRVL